MKRMEKYFKKGGPKIQSEHFIAKMSDETKTGLATGFGKMPQNC